MGVRQAEAAAVFDFVSQIQATIGLWHDLQLDEVDRLSPMWRLVECIPECESNSARSVVAINVAGLARHVLTELDRDDPFRRRYLPSAGRAHLVSLLRSLLDAARPRTAKLEELAGEVGVSKWYLSHLVRNQTGQRLSTLVVIVRLLKAVSLIEAGGLSVKEVAANVGFSSTSEMDRQFRRWLHISPREFRHFLVVFCQVRI